jgi:hypothetical protein
MADIMKEHGPKVPISFGTGADFITNWAHDFAEQHKHENGGKLVCQIQTRPQSMHMSFSAHNPFEASKVFRTTRRHAKGDLKKLYAELANPTTRAKIMIDMAEFKEGSGKDTQGNGMLKNSTGAMIPKYFTTCQGFFPWHKTYEPGPEASVRSVAKKQGKEPLDLAYDLLLDQDGPHAGVLWRALFGYEGNNNKIMKVLEMDHVIPGFDDAGAHCSILTDATAPTHLVSYYTKDRDGYKLPVQRAVQLLTSKAADLFGLDDRGVLKPGKRADINVCDLEKLDIKEPMWANDLPTGAGRWVQYSEGYRMTLLRGQVTFENDQHTGLLPGGLVRNPKRIGLENVSSVAAVRDDGKTPSAIDLTDHAVGISSGDSVGMSAIARTLRESAKTVQSSTRSKL